MSTLNLFQISLEIWGCLLCVIASIVSGNKAFQFGGLLKRIWLMLLLNGMMLISDALAYVFDGDLRTFAVIMSRVGNFLLYTMEGVLTYQFVRMVQEMIQQNEEKPPLWVRICEIAVAAQLLGALLTPFTGFYYCFDSHNHYMRSAGIYLSFAALGIAFGIASVQMFRYRRRFTSGLWRVTRISLVIFAVCFLIQMGKYGFSLINVSVTMVLLLLFSTLWMDAQRQQIQQEIDYLESIIAQLRQENTKEG